MAICKESNIEFNFGAARQVYTHDSKCSCIGDNVNADGNTIWPGVDFRIRCETGWIWIEVKNWRKSAPGVYQKKMNSETFAQEMRQKLLGTIAFLAANRHEDACPRPLTLIFLFEPELPADPALKGGMQHKIRKQLHNALSPFGISFAVLDMADWNRIFPDLPARHI